MAHSHRQTSPDFAKFARVDGPWPIEALRARFENHRFSAHAHDTWSIGAVVAGAKDISAKKGRSQIFGVNQVYFLPPHSPHAGRAVDKVCEYVMLYLPDEAFREQCNALNVDLQQLRAELPADPQQAKAIQTFVSQILRSSSYLDVWSGEWSLFCESLLAKYRKTAISKEVSSSKLTDPAIRRVYEYLHEFWNQNVSLGDLSRESSLSTSDVCRRFSAAYGLTPHRYQLVFRVMQAKSLLLKGAQISEVAAETGFADQSHFGRHFKSVVGVTPGCVARASL
ncbi:AraC family transcriptional regulator [Caballeronia novacaledonica]|uniref:AraC family transcriptional regulator n=1 Tax=Caballeronia novacaledonica TaxID=1544861 RepID=UPI001EE2A8AA|nr:AraC family transcriptional regulator [Caballeronia novacaledonica]